MFLFDDFLLAATSICFFFQNDSYIPGYVYMKYSTYVYIENHTHTWYKYVDKVRECLREASNKSSIAKSNYTHNLPDTRQVDSLWHHASFSSLSFRKIHFIRKLNSTSTRIDTLVNRLALENVSYITHTIISSFSFSSLMRIHVNVLL